MNVFSNIYKLQFMQNKINKGEKNDINVLFSM